ncbi:MAG: helix-turn-helix transcriptional regulator [Clostridia bacterium]|nr:helix-turn-helix transcriptional regulator [Clostridia bacterium]
MLFEEINPFLRQALSAQLTKQNKTDTFNRIKTVDARLFYIVDGSGKMRFKNKTCDLRAGTVILFSAGTEYTWEVDAVGYYAINFDYTQNFSHIRQTFHPISATAFTDADIIERPHFDDCPLLNEPLILPYAPAFENEIKRIVTEYLIGDPYARILNSGTLKTLIVTAVRQAAAPRTVTDEKSTATVKKVVEYIGKHYAEEITYQTLADEFHFNPCYLNRIFKAYTGKSVYAFVLHYRLQTAMEILRTQNLYVNQVSLLCGFPNPYHFTKAFKKFTGCSPTEYRHRNAHR